MFTQIATMDGDSIILNVDRIVRINVVTIVKKDGTVKKKGDVVMMNKDSFQVDEENLEILKAAIGIVDSETEAEA